MGLLIVGIAATVGCSDEKRVEVHPVKGKIIFQGGVPEGAQVVLHPVSAVEESKNLTASGTVKTDGTFHIGVYEDGDGAPPGEYIATVQWFRLITSEAGGGRGPNVLPDKYAHASTSPFHVSVKPGDNELKPFDVTY